MAVVSVEVGLIRENYSGEHNKNVAKEEIQNNIESKGSLISRVWNRMVNFSTFFPGNVK